MKFFRLVCISSLVVCFLGCSCFAVETTGSAISESVEIFQDDNLPANITLVVNQPDNSERLDALESTINSLADSSRDEISPFDGLQLMSVNVSTERISASDSNGFKAVILGLLGDYETIITDYTYSSQQGYTQHSIDIMPDYAWCGCCLVFALVVFCFFRLVGGFLCRQ